MMKKSYQFLSKLLGLSLILSFVACSQGEDTDPIMELYDHLEVQFEINTFEPTVSGETVELSGDIIKTLPKYSIEYGFMWVLDIKCPEPDDMGFMKVNEGVFTGEYELKTSELPKGKDLLVCAYLISSTDKRIRIAGKEFKLRL